MIVTPEKFRNGWKKLGILLKGVPSGVAFLIPNYKNFGDLYPPLGGLQQDGMFVTNILLVIAFIGVYVYCRRNRRVSSVAYAALTSVLIIFIAIFTWTYSKYVLYVPITATGQTRRVSVGCVRVPAPTGEDSQKSAYEVLTDSGADEVEIEKLWTPNSISAVRMTLLLSYTLMLVCASLLLSFFVYQYMVLEE